jgi:hypothetical protein
MTVIPQGSEMTGMTGFVPPQAGALADFAEEDIILAMLGGGR